MNSIAPSPDLIQQIGSVQFACCAREYSQIPRSQRHVPRSAPLPNSLKKRRAVGQRTRVGCGGPAACLLRTAKAKPGRPDFFENFPQFRSAGCPNKGGPREFVQAGPGIPTALPHTPQQISVLRFSAGVRECPPAVRRKIYSSNLAGVPNVGQQLGSLQFPRSICKGAQRCRVERH